MRVAILVAFLLASPVGITYYGSTYTGGEIMANGAAYQPDGLTCALGPALLRQVREATGEEWPYIIIYVNGQCERLHVTDTGTEELGVDLPDSLWARLTGKSFDAGVAWGGIWTND